ncbi:MAG: hypothetical protein EBS24_06330 [Chitinophagia bacterium]|nr:hypothetical protein [Chitinophagia bacterium]
MSEEYFLSRLSDNQLKIDEFGHICVLDFSAFRQRFNIKSLSIIINPCWLTSILRHGALFCS